VAGNSIAIITKRSSTPRIPWYSMRFPNPGGVRPDVLDRAVIIESLDIKPEMRRDGCSFADSSKHEHEFWLYCSMPQPQDLETCPTSGPISCHRWPMSRLGKCVRGEFGMQPGEALGTYQSNRTETHKALESLSMYEPDWPGRL